MSSQLKTGLLLGLLTAIVLLIGQAIGGRGGLMLAFLFAIVMNVGSYWFSDKIVLSMYRARELAPEDAPMLHAMVDELAAEARIPKPKLYVVPQESPNAFATGRNPENAAVAVTEGIMHLLSPEELRGVIAHELAHVKNRDILVQTVAAVLAGVIVMLANWVKWTAIFGFGRSDEEGGGNPLAALAMAIVAPIAATIIQFAISRSREYLADETGARISRSPLSLAGALEKLSRGSERVPLHGNQATENMFIVNPFSGRSMMSLFSTHPPIEERVARLRQMAGAR
ncbi:zinc metalloprotease HtpX [Desulfocurvibacter africanus]|uniref:Protease HtpX homolog n=1 Tax=Desulfocurvibacter africanus subsp. africanus str. Walvis Bay TaxID=690850 RepID=F3YWA0_DESAF|nr:zinc metalloprotease HtpX [Desulfocurvibacter africanus]EGJ49203.1 protease htpX [Desulfocurvibacter africanus subsp. africanus str. Walvis Bay]